MASPATVDPWWCFQKSLLVAPLKLVSLFRTKMNPPSQILDPPLKLYASQLETLQGYFTCIVLLFIENLMLKY